MEGSAADTIPLRLLCPNDFLSLYELQFWHVDSVILDPEKEKEEVYVHFKLLANSRDSQLDVRDLLFRATLSEDRFLQFESDTIIVNNVDVVNSSKGILENVIGC